LIANFIEENLKKSSMSRQPERPPENEPFLFWHVRESASYSTTVVTFTRQLMTAFDHVDVGEKRVCYLGSLQTEKKKAEKTVELVLCFVKEKSASLEDLNIVGVRHPTFSCTVSCHLHLFRENVQ
jgi:hypothetical protein